MDSISGTRTPAALDLDALLAPQRGPSPDTVERLIMTAVTDDDTAEATRAISTLCDMVREGGPWACRALTQAVLDAAAASDDGGRPDIARAIGILCTSIPDLQEACAVERDAESWARRYPVLAARPASSLSPLRSLVDAALAVRRIRAARRCALYALYASVAAVQGTATPLPPYGSIGLRGLEQWARDWQTDVGGAVPALPLVGPVDDADDVRTRMFPVILDAAEATPLSQNDMVAMTYTQGPASLYGQLVQTRQQVALSLANAVSRELANRLAFGLLATRSTGDVPRACLDNAINIFLVYPGTRPAVARHFRKDPSSAIDVGVLLNLPEPHADSAGYDGTGQEDEWGTEWL